MHKPLLTAVTILFLGVSGLDAEATFEIDPPVPLSTEAVQIRATYLSNCFLGMGRAEVKGRVIRLFAYEACVCPEIAPFPVGLTTTVGPLASGRYALRLFVDADPFDPECRFGRRSEGKGKLTVGMAEELITIVPSAPKSRDRVRVIVRSRCPQAFEAPSRHGSLIRITEIPSQILAPCSDEPVWETRLFLGVLPVGGYSLVLVFDDGSSPPFLTLTRSFEVREAGRSEP